METWRAAGEGLGCAPVGVGSLSVVLDGVEWDWWRHLRGGFSCTHTSHFTLHLIAISLNYSQQFAVEVTRIMHDAAEALFDLRVPLPPEAVQGLLAGVDASLAK